MLFAIFGLAPGLFAVLAAVCSIRLGICALHGQLLYFVTLLLFSVTKTTVTTLFTVPLLACFMFVCGTIGAHFMLRADLTLPEGNRRIAGTAMLFAINLLLLLFLLHNLFDIMCLSLEGSTSIEWVATLAFVVKAVTAACITWALVLSLLGLRRLGQCALYGLCAYLLSTYIYLSTKAQLDGTELPKEVSSVLSRKLVLPCYSLPPDAQYSAGIYIIPALAAVPCAIFGFTLLQKGKRKPKVKTKAKGQAKANTQQKTQKNSKLPQALQGNTPPPSTGKKNIAANNYRKPVTMHKKATGNR